MLERKATLIILAAERTGIENPLAQRFGVSHKCLARLHGRALIAHVTEAAQWHPSVGKVIISVEMKAFDAIRAALPAPDDRCASVHLSAAASNLADSVIQAAAETPGPYIITTADNVLLSADSITAMVRALTQTRVAIAMSPRASVLAAHPEGQRRFYRFRDGEYSNCNLYGIADGAALRASEIFRGGGQFSKKVCRVIDAFGLVNLLLLRFRLVSLESGLRRVSGRIGMDIGPVILTDGSQAIDVDNDRTYAVAYDLLRERFAKRPASDCQIAA